MADQMSNKQVEAAAITYVMEYEARNGRVARDTRHQGEAADLKSSERVIEVKAYGSSGRGADLWLESRQVEEALTNSTDSKPRKATLLARTREGEAILRSALANLKLRRDRHRDLTAAQCN